MLDALGERFSAASVVADRLAAQSMLELAAAVRRDEAKGQRAKGLLAHTRHLAAAENRLCLAWPLEGLGVEVTDALAKDEAGLYARCLFPSS